jgi:hypothetical protein
MIKIDAQVSGAPLSHRHSVPGSPPSTLFCTTVRTVSPGVLMAAPNTPAQKPERDRQRVSALEAIRWRVRTVIVQKTGHSSGWQLVGNATQLHYIVSSVQRDDSMSSLCLCAGPRCTITGIQIEMMRR